MVNAVEDSQWTNVVKALETSEQLLQATLEGDEETVARFVDAAHDENAPFWGIMFTMSLSCRKGNLIRQGNLGGGGCRGGSAIGLRCRDGCSGCR